MIKITKNLIVLATLLAFPVYPGFAEEEDMSAAGFDSERIEQEDKLWVPVEKADQVWQFLENRFVKDTAYIKGLDPRFETYWHLEEFWDTYFDTPSFQLLSQQNGVRHRKRINHSDPDHRKSGRELMQIKVNSISANPLERAEIKYAIEYPSRINTKDERHPMLGIVKEAHREGFKKRLTGLGIDPYAMRPIVTVHDNRSRIYFTREKKPFMSISMDRCDASLLWAKYQFIEIEPELNEIGFTDADPETRRYMEKILADIVREIQTEFPFIKRELTPKYGKSFHAMEERIPGLRQLVKVNMHRDMTGLSLAGVAVVGILAAGGYLGIRSLGKRRSAGRAR